MKKVLKMLLVVAVFATLLPASIIYSKAADLVCNEADYTYIVDTVNEVTTITGYTGSDVGIILPSALGGYPVTTIGREAFKDCNSLEEIMFPDSLTTIGINAFKGCSGFTTIVLPDSVEEIGFGAFADCTNLSGINYPLNWSSTTGDGCVFKGCSKLTSMTVPDGITQILPRAFSGADYLEEVILPTSLISIGRSAFEGCVSLEGIEFPNDLTTIGINSFKGCSGFTTIVLPDSVEEIGFGAFADCTNLSGINYPFNWSSTTGDGCVFKGCSKLTSMTVPDGITQILPRAFSGADYLEEVILPTSLTSIGESSFNACTSLTDVYYVGTEQQWKLIAIGDDNDCLVNATLHYGSVRVASVSLSEEEKSLTVGDSFTLSAVILPEDAENKEIYWKTSAPSVATVTNGVVTAVAPGTVTITVMTVDGNKTATCDVTVKEVVVNFAYGDANGDNVINTKDIIILRQYLAGKDPITGESTVEIKAGSDANGDGVVNTKDIIILRQYLAAKDPITGVSSVVLGPNA